DAKYITALENELSRWHKFIKSRGRDFKAPGQVVFQHNNNSYVKSVLASAPPFDPHFDGYSCFFAAEGDRFVHRRSAAKRAMFGPAPTEGYEYRILSLDDASGTECHALCETTGREHHGMLLGKSGYCEYVYL
ncbi:hypothetical protein KIPB_013640, partial [Kipferlia bialata]